MVMCSLNELYKVYLLRVVECLVLPDAACFLFGLRRGYVAWW
jgi:hypothetical protein